MELLLFHLILLFYILTGTYLLFYLKFNAEVFSQNYTFVVLILFAFLLVISNILGYFGGFYKLSFYLYLFNPILLLWYFINITQHRKREILFFTVVVIIAIICFEVWLNLNKVGFPEAYNYNLTSLLSLFIYFSIFIYSTLLLNKTRKQNSSLNLSSTLDITISIVLIGEILDSFIFTRYLKTPMKYEITYPVALLLIHKIHIHNPLSHIIFNKIFKSSKLALLASDEELNILKINEKANKLFNLDNNKQEKIHKILPDDIVFTKKQFFFFTFLNTNLNKKIEGVRFIVNNNKQNIFFYIFEPIEKKINFKNLLQDSSYNKIYPLYSQSINESRLELFKTLSEYNFNFEATIKKILDIVSDVTEFEIVNYYAVQYDKSLKCLYETSKTKTTSIGLEVPSYIVKPLLNKEPLLLTSKEILNLLPHTNKSIAKSYITELWANYNLDFVITIPIRNNTETKSLIFLNTAKKSGHIKPSWTNELRILVSDISYVVSKLLILHETHLEQQETIKSLQKSEQKYRNIFDHLYDVYFRTDANGEIILISPSCRHIFGAKPVDMIGRNIISDFFVYYEEQEEFYHKLESNGFVSEFEVEMYDTKDQKIWISINANYFIDNNGEIIGIEGMCRDISERKTLEEQLIRAERVAAVGTLAGGLAHEFNNINMTILGYAELGLMKTNKTDEIGHYFKTIRSSTKRAESITKHLLTFATKKSVKLKSGNLANVIEDTCIMMEHELKKNNIKLIKELKSLPPTLMNSHQIGQVVMNLLINAQHALIESKIKKIKISTYYDEKNVYFEVSDTGCGIPKKNLQKIFSPFFTTKGEHTDENSPLRQVKGTGLGLSVSQTIINNHKGNISVSSKIGENTTFKVSIPIVKEFYRSDSTPSYSSLNNVPSANIIVIDDEPDLRELLQTFLTEQGHQVWTSDKKDTILEYITHKKPDVILLDLNIPDLDTASLLNFINQLNPEDKPIVMIMTGQPDISKETFEGVFDIIHKPFKLDAFSSYIRKATNHRLKIIKEL